MRKLLPLCCFRWIFADSVACFHLLGVAGAGTNVQTNEEVAIKLVSSCDHPLGFQHTRVYDFIISFQYCL
jgi:hypothetical protein